MTYQRTILLTSLFSLGVLLSACGMGAAPSNDKLATTAVPPGYAFCFYENVDFGGERICYTSDTAGAFSTPMMPEFWNDRISSVEIRPGSLTLLSFFTDTNFGGGNVQITGDTANLGGFNDQISSFEDNTLAPGQ